MPILSRLSPKTIFAQIAVMAVVLLTCPLTHAADASGKQAKEWTAAGFKRLDASKTGNWRMETKRGVVQLDRLHQRFGNLRAADLKRIIAAMPAGDKLPKDDELVLKYTPLFGAYLRNDEVLLAGFGKIDNKLQGEKSRPAESKALVEAVTKLQKELGSLLPDERARKAMDGFLTILSENSRSRLGDEIDGPFARHLVRHGWLQESIGKAPAVSAVEAAVAKASALQANRTYTGGAGTFTMLSDAYGRHDYLWKTKDSLKVMRPMRRPVFADANAGGLRMALLVLDYGKASSVPSDPLQDLVSASLFIGRDRVVHWQNNKTEIDAKAWRKAVPTGRSRDVVRNYLPPHLVITDAASDVYALVTKDGMIKPPGNSEADRKNFLKEAAALLPDAAHLDLIGQYFFRYTYDSPDPTRPGFVGNRDTSGDIHQTADQTLATTSGGICRGDCDDISELYQEIAQKQGKLAHVITLPAHAAAAWAEQKNGNWHTYVLQTGPAYEFIHKDLGESLKQAYQHFDATETFDPNGLGLLLRFSGENTRSSWRLSSRIFTDRVYAETMIDVQRDWHYQTYLEGIRKMEKLIADGDKDNANFREMAGLAAFTGQYDKAVDYLRKAKGMTEGAANKLNLDIEIAQHLISGERKEEAAKLVEDILHKQIPGLRQKLGLGILQIGMSLANAAASSDQPALGAKALEATALQFGNQMLRRLQGLVGPRYNADRWAMDGSVNMMRRIVGGTAGTAVRILAETEDGAGIKDPKFKKCLDFANAYLKNLAFWDIQDAGGIPSKYALAATMHRLSLGAEELEKRVIAAKAPTAKIDHRKRGDGEAQLKKDLPWIKISTPYWSGRIGDCFTKKQKTLATDRLKRYKTLLADAAKASAAFEMTGMFTGMQMHLSELMLALGLQDEAKLRSLLKHVKEQNDKRLRDSTAQTIGECARLLPTDWFNTVMDVWEQEVDYKPKYYWIAWRAALTDGTEQALIAAKRAADRFKDDKAFVEEYKFMKKLLSEQKTKK